MFLKYLYKKTKLLIYEILFLKIGRFFELLQH